VHVQPCTCTYISGLYVYMRAYLRLLTDRCALSGKGIRGNAFQERIHALRQVHGQEQFASTQSFKPHVVAKVCTCVCERKICIYLTHVSSCFQASIQDLMPAILARMHDAGHRIARNTTATLPNTTVVYAIHVGSCFIAYRGTRH
jgi:hypothetical protein